MLFDYVSLGLLSLFLSFSVYVTSCFKSEWDGALPLALLLLVAHLITALNLVVGVKTKGVAAIALITLFAFYWW